MKQLGIKIEIHSNKTPNYTTKNVNAHIIYDFHNWSKIQLKNFTLKILWFGSINIAKNGDKYKYVHSGYGIAFDRLRS